ncbi:hypothetical protein HPB48_015808 [Haemaphysalis longicornis]|uniref:Uncharacterized protein n=1 Tax=Haemaphysalis longicornis TaxID=44386 RepID=A0A9J6G785_HAELO|nr:hypothetical protein HPB48_015808 [Haemaphysalis longicornis]
MDEKKKNFPPRGTTPRRARSSTLLKLKDSITSAVSTAGPSSDRKEVKASHVCGRREGAVQLVYEHASEKHAFARINATAKSPQLCLPALLPRFQGNQRVAAEV